MNTLIFVATVSGGKDAGYRAAFPDLPGCVAEGPDLAALLVNARKAVGERLQALSDAGDPWPEPTAIEDVAASAGTTIVPVDVSVDDAPVRVNISIGERLLQRLDAAAEARGMTRSGFISQAVRVSLGERAGGPAPLDAASQWLQDELGAMGRKISDSLGPDSAFSRRMAELDDRIAEGVRQAADNVSAAMARLRDANRPGQDGDRRASRGV